MKILVTGSSGRAGSALCPVLEEAGHEVVPFDLLNERNIMNTATLALHMEGCDAVVHLAAIPWAMANKNAEEYWEVNVRGTRNVANIAVWKGVKRLVLASSTGYYGFQRGFPLTTKYTGPVLEDDYNVVQRYGMLPADMPDMKDAQNRAGIYYMTSKVAAETAVAMYAMAGLIEAVVLRFAPVLDKPYEWGLRCGLDHAIQAILWAVTKPASYPFDVYNIGDEDIKSLVTYDFVMGDE